MGDDGRHVIAIIGSANLGRNGPDHSWPYDPPLAHPDVVMEACERLGGELAVAGWDIVVYAGEGNLSGESDGFIEPAVVKGYLASGAVRSASVHVLYSRRFPTPVFAGHATQPEAFEFSADLSKDWEPSFYRSLANVDAGLIIGGGQSSYLAGLVCLGRRIPLLALGTFGGAAHRALDAMIDAGTPLRREDFEVLGRPAWTPASAKALVDSLATQKASLDREREELQRERRSRRRSQNAAVAVALFGVASLLVPTALVVTKADTWPELALLFVAPLVAGASGGTVRTLLPQTTDAEISTLGSAALGAVAGGISGLLYLSA